MEKVKKAIADLEKSKEFEDWKKENKDSYFSYAFNMVKGSDLEDWQLGFYDKKTDKVTTFIIKKQGIEIVPEQDIFKKDETEVKEIDMSEDKFTVDDILKKAQEFQENNCPKDAPAKIIIILQNLQGFGNIWNITYVTKAFNTLNMKISTSTARVLEHKVTPLMDFREK
jgi:hypothetical protein